VRRQEIIEEFDESGRKTGRHAGSNADQIRADNFTVPTSLLGRTEEVI